MIPVILESPFGGPYIEENKKYLQACIRDCLARGESPYASHQMLTQALDDATPTERELGINAGFAMHSIIKKSVVYLDHGRSSGMTRGVANAPWSIIKPHEYRAEDAIW